MKKMWGTMICSGLLLIGAWQAAAATYKLGMVPLIGWAEYRVADVKGFWKKQGIDIELIDYSLAGAEHRRAFQQSRFDIAPVPLASVANLRETGIPDLIYLGTLSAADHHKNLIMKKELVNKSLKGQTIGIFANDVANMFLLTTYLKSVNTTVADVRLVEVPATDLIANFTAGRLPVILAFEMGDRSYEQADGVIALSTQTFYEPHGLTMRKSVFETMPPDDLKKMMRGCVEAIEWIRDPANWDEYKAILKQYFLAGRADVSDDQIREFIKEGKFFDPKTLLAHNQQQLSDYFVQFRAFLETEGMLKGDLLNAFTYEDVIHNQALIEVLQEFGQ